MKDKDESDLLQWESDHPLANKIQLFNKCVDFKMASRCHPVLKGTKVRSMAICNTRHLGKVQSCQQAAKVAHTECMDKDPSSRFFDD